MGPAAKRLAAIDRRRLELVTAAALIALIAIGAVFRFSKLDKDSLWYDEIASWHTSGHARIAEVIFADRVWHLHPPGYHVMLHVVQRTLGESEFALRLPSAIMGLLCIPLIFALGVRLYSRSEGLIAAGLFAVLLQPVYYAQEARPYAGLLLWVLLGTLLWTYVRERFREGTKRWAPFAVGYAFVGVLCCYWHYFGLLATGLQALALAALTVRTRADAIRFAAVYGAIGLAYVPWLPSMLMQMQNALGYPPPEHGMARAFIEYLYFLYNHSAKLLPVVVALYGWLLAQSLWDARRAEAGFVRTLVRSPGFWLLLWLVLPFAIAYLKSIVSASVFTHKNLLISLPAAYLLLARAIERLPFGRTMRIAVAAGLIGLAAYRLAFVSEYYRVPQKEQFREAVAYIVEHEDAYVPSLVAGHHWFPFSFDYYFERLESERRIAFFGGKTGDIASLADALERVKPRYVWYICAYPEAGSHMDAFLGAHSPKPDPAFLAFLREEYGEIRHEIFRGVEVYLFGPPD